MDGNNLNEIRETVRAGGVNSDWSMMAVERFARDLEAAKAVFESAPMKDLFGRPKGAGRAHQRRPDSAA